MNYPYRYTMSADDSEEDPLSGQQPGAPDTPEYTFDGYDIEINVKVALNPVSKTGQS
ncbi:hypothetical protein [Chitinophaga solisilvae]|uniref:Uncharacterized protein n=1 Tax=Chitinophaga solisilvae TaxID=1233460 RepID=A0A9Q5D4F7_9BACT|nr:hypothetical protein [Chitinophaga solisilvae]NSL90808.1 hypothetical protein [Chitinophaga solisilvae]